MLSAAISARLTMTTVALFSMPVFSTADAQERLALKDSAPLTVQEVSFVLKFVFIWGAQGRGSHSAGGANAPPTYGPMAPRLELAPPTFAEIKWPYLSYGDG